jgi:hypothetical protein
MALLRRDVFTRGAGRAGVGRGGDATETVGSPPREAGPVPRQEVGRRLRRLLTEADNQDAAAGRAAWLSRAVDHLVPDEARLLAVLAEPAGGVGCPLVHIHCVTPTGLSGEVLLENLASVGDPARLALPQLVPYYVGRLVALDLVEIGPEDDRFRDEYHGLLARPEVLAALASAREQGLTPRVMRHTLRLSPLGRELWESQFAAD